MTQHDHDDDKAARALGATAIGGPLAGAGSLLGGHFGEDPERSHDLRPTPIGSDPWLSFEVRAALARDPETHGLELVVEVEGTVVTIRGLSSGSVERVERAVRTVKGIRTLHVERGVSRAAP